MTLKEENKIRGSEGPNKLNIYVGCIEQDSKKTIRQRRKSEVITTNSLYHNLREIIKEAKN